MNYIWLILVCIEDIWGGCDLSLYFIVIVMLFYI